MQRHMNSIHFLFNKLFIALSPFMLIITILFVHAGEYAEFPKIVCERYFIVIF
ncbi:hypothetical protein CLOSTHATH_03682 [Hungatella hathewayi DSM 13479]|uniref:Uncharacterized protein n=1 Tax=Hungatella hathewayi DSM 13479 TaxID=566550 RepID=D3AJ91_9FIRM|nr:hypothetical protein CLOSTHATH_03682 [Hungatella hathewayi DSM 13479]